MSKSVTRSTNPPIHPKRYFDASPTWFAWNNLTATDVHALRTEPGFEGQNVYFYGNHPIRFVRLVGIVVGIDLKVGKHLLLEIDDSSGACIEVKTSIRDIQEGDRTEYPSNTSVDTLDVHVNLNGIPTVRINKQRIDIGTVIKAKGTLDAFRGTRQLKLARVWIVEDTNQEAKAWEEAAAWKRDVLSVPWLLTDTRRQEIDEQIQKDALEEQVRAKKRRVRDAEMQEKTKRKLEKRERRRRREEAMYNAGALPGSSTLPNGWSAT